MTRVCTCRGCGMSFNGRDSGRRPVWCDQCRSVRLAEAAARPCREIPASHFIAVRLAAYSAATRLALCHIQRHEYAQATAVLTAAKDAA